MFSRNAILAALQVVLFLNAVWVIWKDGISDYLFPAGARRFSSANQRVRLIHGNPPSSNFGPLLNGRPGLLSACDPVRILRASRLRRFPSSP